MAQELGIRERASLLLQRFGLGGGGGGAPSASGELRTPDTIRHSNMSADVPIATDGGIPVTTTIPFSASTVSLSGELQRVVDRVKQLLRSGFLDPVTKRDAGAALTNLSALSPEDRARAVEALGADLMTRLESKISSQDRKKHAGLIAGLRAARNAPVGAPDRDAFLQDAHRTLRGLLELTWVTEEQARRIVDQLRRFPPKEQDALLDDLGPGRLQWLTSALSKLDREIYAPTVDCCRTAHIGAINRYEASQGLSPKDVSKRFLEILEEVERGTMKLDPEKHGGVTFLFVPGLMTEHQPGYFERNMKRLEERGLRVELSKIDTDADIETNRKVIAGEMKAYSGGEDQKVFVVSHSKGGPDVRAALVDPEIDRLAFCWNAMQSACGTPVAHTLMEGPVGAVIERALVSLFGAPNGNALRDLDYRTQKQLWIGKRPIETPILSLATTVGDHPSKLRESDHVMQRRYRVKTDGLVPYPEQLVGGKNAFSIELDGVDHAAPAARPLPGRFAPKHDPADLQEAQILLAFELAERVAASQ